MSWLIPEDGLFAEDRFHGNIKWEPEQLSQQALIWAWQDTRKVTDAFEQALEVCGDLNIGRSPRRTQLSSLPWIGIVTVPRRLRQRFQFLAEEMAGRFWRDKDGS